MTCVLASRELGGNAELQKVAHEIRPPLKRWAQGAEVQQVQRAMRALEPDCDLGRSFDKPGADGRPPDGIYGDKTWQAIKAFQVRQFPTHPEWHTGFCGWVTLCAMDRMLQRRASAGGGAAGASAGATAPQLADPDLEQLRQRLAAGTLANHVAPGVDHEQVGIVHAVLMDDARVRLGVVWRNPGLVPGGNWLNPTGTIRGWVDAYRPLVALSGSFALLSRGGRLSGSVVAGGHRSPGFVPALPDAERFDRFQGRIHGAFICYVAHGGARRWRFGVGRAPLEARGGGHVTMGLDGLVPMILTSAEGRRVYGPTDPWYRALQDRHAIGLVVVAHNPDTDRLIVLVQDWHRPAYDLDTLRDLTLALGCHHAVALDGSDSAMLSCGGHWLLVNDDWKNRLNPNALVFFAA